MDEGPALVAAGSTALRGPNTGGELHGMARPFGVGGVWPGATAQLIPARSVSTGCGGRPTRLGGAVDSRMIRVGSYTISLGTRDAAGSRTNSTASLTPSATISLVGIRRVVRAGMV
jgi:hypothetical protein